MSTRPGRTLRIGRRRFLKIGLMTFGAAAFGGSGLVRADSRGMVSWLAWYARAARNRADALRHPHLSPAERIEQYFDYLKLDKAGVRRYVYDYQKRYGPVSLRADFVRPELFPKFLLSSDFFVNGADESRTVSYVALYDPYSTPCRSPFLPALGG